MIDTGILYINLKLEIEVTFSRAERELFFSSYWIINYMSMRTTESNGHSRTLHVGDA